MDFDAAGSTRTAKALRLLISLAAVAAVLVGLDAVVEAIAPVGSMLDYGLYYLRYAAAGAVAILLAPALFVRLGPANPK